MKRTYLEVMKKNGLLNIRFYVTDHLVNMQFLVRRQVVEEIESCSPGDAIRRNVNT